MSFKIQSKYLPPQWPSELLRFCWTGCSRNPRSCAIGRWILCSSKSCRKCRIWRTDLHVTSSSFRSLSRKLKSTACPCRLVLLWQHACCRAGRDSFCRLWFLGTWTHQVLFWHGQSTQTWQKRSRNSWKESFWCWRYMDRPWSRRSQPSPCKWCFWGDRPRRSFCEHFHAGRVVLKCVP